MKHLIESYRSYEPTKECWLDGRYVDAVLDNYSGYARKHLTIDIAKDETADVDGPTSFDLNPDHVELVRIRIAIDSNGDILRHSNLLIIDSKHREVYRFEPMMDHHYNDILDEVIRRYAKDVIPQYEYMEMSQHPETNENTCAHEGLCVAYVIMVGVLFALGMTENVVFTNDDIRRFVSAVKDQYNV
jgi:hypothetical protein